MFNALELTLRGDGRTYICNLQTDGIDCGEPGGVCNTTDLTYSFRTSAGGYVPGICVHKGRAGVGNH